ncbi:DUF547 domain-containing protein [bacterium SCSIO 12741]|nr:DUF547 domain-containing protein [bacterium SCSIO 12741]
MGKIFTTFFIGLLIGGPLALLGQSSVQLEDEMDSFFKQSVTNGRVDYDQLHNHPEQLKALVKKLEPASQLPQDSTDQKAFWINAYNVLVIYEVIQNYPLSSVKDVQGFFERKNYVVAGNKLSLNDIENKILRKQWKDSRIHFVLVCGAIGCPPIIPEAYRSSQLDDQLTRQTQAALNDPKFIQVKDGEETVLFSSIFKWYKSDFLNESDGLISYLNTYRETAVPGHYKEEYYEYDWSLNGKSRTSNSATSSASDELNLQQYTPSVLLSSGQWEVKLFQNLYTQKGGYDDNSEFAAFGQRSTFFTSINQFTYGINRRINVGADLWVKSVLYHNPDDSPLQIFRFQNTPDSRTALSAVGPRIRVNPIKKWSHFAVQTTFLIPVADNQDGSDDPELPWLSRDAYLWTVRLNYDMMMGQKFQWFFQMASWYTVGKPGEATPNQLELPVDIFLTYFPTQRLSFYAQNQFWPQIKENGEPSGYFLQGGLGAKFQLIPGFMELETSYTNFYYGRNSGAGQTFNLGIRLLGG